MPDGMEKRPMHPKLAEILERNKIERENRANAGTPIVEQKKVETTEAPATTAEASKRLSKEGKKKPNDFPTFIEKSLPPRDRD